MFWAAHRFPPWTPRWHHVPQAYESISRVPDSWGGDQMDKGVMRAFALLLESPSCSPCTSLRGDVTVEPTLSSASLQPKQGCPQRPFWTGQPCSPVCFGKASSWEKEVCACKTPRLVGSHKHKAPACIAFQISDVLEKVQRSGMNFPDWRQQRYHLVSQWVTETRERQFTREIRRSN